MNQNKLKILCVFNNCKSIQYIFDAIIELSKNNIIYYYFNHQTSRSIFKWDDLFISEESDIIIKLSKILEKNKCIKIGESKTKKYDSDKNIKYIKKCLKKIDNLDICIFDDSSGVWKGNSHGYNYIYKIIKKIHKNVKVIGCIEGIKDFNCKNNMNENFKNTELESISKSLNLCYDYIFCLSKFQNSILNNYDQNKNIIYNVGIPYLDKFNKYLDNLEENFILLFTSWPKYSKAKKWLPLDEENIKDIIKLALNMNLKLIIKEKPRNKYSYKYLENENIIVTMCEGEELDNLISKSKIIISVPSSVLVRGLVLNKPTIILNDKYYGQLGFLKDFKGIINNFKIEEINNRILFFENNKNYIVNFMKENFYGYDFTAIKKFKNYINEILLGKFWQINKDRLYLKNVLYPNIGKFLNNNSKVLDIGCRKYNKYNKLLFNNNNINYTVLDIKNKNDEEVKDVLKDEYINSSILDMTEKNEYKNKFDVVISLGVLGFYYFTEKDTIKYLKNVDFLLKDNGIFIVKLDYYEKYKKNIGKKSGDKYWTMKKPNFDLFFNICDDLNINTKLELNKNDYYQFFSFRKKNIL